MKIKDQLLMLFVVTFSVIGIEIANILTKNTVGIGILIFLAYLISPLYKGEIK